MTQYAMSQNHFECFSQYTRKEKKKLVFYELKKINFGF